MTDHISTIILGASCCGCAIASRRPGSLILEPTIQPGAEFTLTGSPGRNLSCPAKHSETRAFQEELERRKVIENGFLQNAALAPVLAKWCLERNLAMRLNAPVVRRNGSQITVMEACGLRDYSADEIIDARPVPGKELYLYSFLSGGDTGEFGGFEVLETIAPERRLLRQRLPLATSYQEARKRLFEFWRNRPGELRDSVLLWSSARFSFDTEDNPVSAMDRGLEIGAK